MRKKPAKFCLVGQILVDVTLSSGKDESKLRLGGVMHAARAMWALGIPYSIAYTAPSYLVQQTKEFATRHGAESCQWIGAIDGCPNVILIPEPTEAGSQGYELLLRDSQKTNLRFNELEKALSATDVTDVLIFPGGFDLSAVLGVLSKSSKRCYVDAAYDVGNLKVLHALKRKFEVVIASTSSELFLSAFRANPHKLRDAVLSGVGRNFLFKENRGGARLFRNSGMEIDVGAQIRDVVHSVGVGDCFDVVYVALRRLHGERAALSYASFISAEYATTTFPDDFRRAVRRTLQIPAEKIVEMHGTRLPWENRKQFHIYIAAPDFDYLDRRPIVAVSEALEYHNFRSRRPVLEGGQAKKGDSFSRKAELFRKDVALLSECKIVVAVLLNNDPGTLVEIGLAKGLRKPVIVFDPYGIADNLFMQQTPDIVSSSLDVVIASVFHHSAQILKTACRDA